MNAAVVFFVALGAFIVVLSRRLWRSGYRLNNLWSNLRIVGSFLATGMLYIGRQIGRLKAVIARRLKVKKPIRITRPPMPVISDSVIAGSHDTTERAFWDESEQKAPELLSHLEEGEELLKQNKLEEAEAYLLKAATKNPRDPRIYADLGQIYLGLKSYSDAIEALKVAVKLDKYNPALYYELARAYWGNKDAQRAIASIREAIGLDPVTEKYRQFLEELLNKK